MGLDHLRIQGLLYDLLNVPGIHFFSQGDDLILISAELHITNGSYALNLGYDIHIVGIDDLTTILPINLVTVILFGIVRCGNHHSTLAAQLPDSKT